MGLRPYLDKFLSWMTIGKVGVILMFFALPGIWLRYQDTAPAGGFFYVDLLRASYTEFVWEILGIAFTVLIIDRLYHVQDVNREKKQLVRQLRSTDSHLVGEAADRLRAQGWLADGTLANINLHGAILPGVDWQTAVLRQTTLERANLRGADFAYADLTNTHLLGADLSFANLNEADVTEAQLQEADRLAHATMPDGTLYDGRYNLEGDLREAQNNGYNLNDPLALSRFYDVPLQTYQSGQHPQNELNR